MSYPFKSTPSLALLAALLAAGGLACQKPSRTAQAPAANVAATTAREEAASAGQADAGLDPRAGDTAEAARMAGAAAQAAEYQKAARVALKDVHFNLDKAVVMASDKPTLVAIAAFMKAYPQANLFIDGNCDERGTVEYNLALGERRSHAAMDYLVGLGVSGDRLGTTTYGKEKPACPEHAESCWIQNRRAHFSLMMVHPI